MKYFLYNVLDVKFITYGTKTSKETYFHVETSAPLFDT